MKEILRKHRKLIIVVALTITIIIIPFIVHCLFKIHPSNEFFVAEWTAGDVLTFYGGLLAAALAVFGVYWTIKDSHDQNKQEEKDRVRPYLALTELKQTFNLDSTGNDQECASADISCYTEKRIDQVFIIIQRNGIKFTDSFSVRQKKLIETGGFYWKRTEKGTTAACKNHLSLPIEFDSVGNGPAVNVQVGFFKENTPDEKCQFVFTMNLHDKIYVHIFSEIEDDSICGKYILDVRYWDVLGTAYKQEFPLDIIMEEDKKFFFTFTVMSKQEDAGGHRP